jgi:hypothetical protein
MDMADANALRSAIAVAAFDVGVVVVSPRMTPYRLPRAPSDSYKVQRISHTVPEEQTLDAAERSNQIYCAWSGELA